MRSLIFTSRFKKDIKLLKKQNKDMTKLQEVFDILIEDDPIPQKYKDHPLRGNMKGFRDLHIESDWVLVYYIDGNDIHLTATGSHSRILKM